MPSSTLRSGARGRPPCRCRGALGSKGRIFSHWGSVSNRPYRAIGPPPGAVHFRDPPPRANNYRKFSPLYRVLQWLLVTRSDEVMSGAVVFTGTRVPVQTLLDYLEEGDTLDHFLEDFPTVTREHAVAALE